LSLLAAEGYRAVVPSAEARDLKQTTADLRSTRDELANLRDALASAQKQRDRFEGMVDAVNLQMAANEEKAKADRQELLNQIESIDEQLEPFIQLARESYPGIPPESALAKLRGDLESLESRTVGLEQRTSPRHLPATQASRISSKLRSQPQRKVLVQFDPTDLEAKTYGQQLAAAVASGGWSIETFELMAIDPTPGVHVFARDNDQAKATATLLHSLLTEAGIQSGIWLSDSGGDWQVKL
jgi:hypothetical protein